MKTNRSLARRLAVMGVMAALSIVLVALVHLPIFPVVAFLEYDPADIPILIVTLLYGPSAGLLLTAVVSVIQGVTVSLQSGVYGILMHFIATSAFVLVLGRFCRYDKSLKRLAPGAGLGVLSVTAVMTVANIFITPLFMGMPIAYIFEFLPFICLFNVIKMSINGAVTLVLYKSLRLLPVFREAAADDLRTASARRAADEERRRLRREKGRRLAEEESKAWSLK